MLTTFALVLLGCAAIAFLTYALGAIAAVRHTSSEPSSVPDAALPPISIVKPLKGVEEQLDANLRTFFEQDYPAPFEIVFATTESSDPALDVARRVARDYPAVPVRFVLSDPKTGLNPKVANLRGALGASTHDLVLQSDANVRIRRDYLRRVVSELIVKNGSLLTSMVVGVGEKSVGAAMENLQLSAFIAPAMCFALTYFRVTCVIGKSMLFRRSELAEVGGIDVVKDILAEDFILGVRYVAAGKRTLLSSTTAENVNVNTTVEQFMSRHTRWLKLRVVIHVPAFVGDLFANPVALATLATLVSGFDLRFIAVNAVMALTKALGDGLLLARTRGVRMQLRHLALSPFKDIIMGAIWPYAAFSRSIDWRGTHMRIGRESRVFEARPTLPRRVFRALRAAFT